MKITRDLKKEGIYCIINIKNKKKYIGSSINIYQRLLKHRSLLRKNKHQNRKLQNSWNKNSEELFDFYILEYCKESELIEREQYYIDTLKPEYNITIIVERNILSKESRKLQSETRKRRIKSGEIKLFSKTIHQYDLEGEYIRSYNTIKEACRENNIHQSTVCRFLNGTYKKGGNYLWSLEYKDHLEPYIFIRNDSGKLCKAVQILQNDEIIYDFHSVKECANYFNTSTSTISSAIKNKRKFRRKYMIIYKTA